MTYVIIRRQTTSNRVVNIPLHSLAKPQESGQSSAQRTVQSSGRRSAQGGLPQPLHPRSSGQSSAQRTVSRQARKPRRTIFSPTAREEPFLQPHIADATTLPSQLRTFPCIVSPSHKAAMTHFFTHGQRRTLFAATYSRIHDNPKPVQNIPLHSPAKPQGRDEPFFQPLAEGNHFCSHILQNP